MRTLTLLRQLNYLEVNANDLDKPAHEVDLEAVLLDFL